MSKLASIVDSKNASDPDVLIHGYGRMRFSQLQKEAITGAENLVKRLKRGDFSTAEYLTNEKKGNLVIFIRALNDLSEDLEKLQKILKRG